MDEVEPGRSEAFARSVLENVIGAQLVARRPPGVDFWLCRGGRAVGGLEVTIGIPQAFARLIAQLEHFGDHIDEPMLETNWQAELDEIEVDLSRWDYVRFGQLVKAIEQHGIRDSHRLRDELFREELQRFGVESLYAVGGTTSGRIYLVPRGWAGAVDGSDVDALVQERLESKQGQLEGVSGERHLFLGVSLGSWAAAAAILGEPSEAPPELPDFVDVVWVLASQEAEVIWRRRRGEKWDIVPIR